MPSTILPSTNLFTTNLAADVSTDLAASTLQADVSTDLAATTLQSAAATLQSTDLLSVPVLVAIALALTPLFVRLFDRHAGWPIVAFFAAAIVQLARLSQQVLSGTTLEWSVPWAGSMLSGAASSSLHDATSPTNSALTLEFALRLDAVSLVFAMLALLIGSVVFVYSTAYLPKRAPRTGAGKGGGAGHAAGTHKASAHEASAHKPSTHEASAHSAPASSGAMSFYLLMTGFMLAVLLLVLANDVALLFIGWELVSMASFLLIARSGTSGELGSLRTLLLTFTGGLFLLAALGIAVAVTGTTNLTDLLASPAWSQHSAAMTAVAVLVALAGFTKAAQFPFHAWLPEAMAAATPVSAFLHAAAVVKAGVYLLIRFSTLFADVRAWQLLLLIAGMSTAVATAYFALQQLDLKKLIAYSTVSQLGWIVATISIGTHFAIVAALVHTVAHAMFKSSLFMLAGVVDHQTGTRAFRRLGPLWRQMPWTFGSMIIGAASMAAIPPTLGFLSKEGMLEAFTDAPLSDAGVVVLLTVAAIGALGTFIYSARLVFGAFVDGPRDVTHVKEAPVALWLPAAIPGVLSLPAGFTVGAFLDEPLNRAVEAIKLEPYGSYHETHLALWHGVSVPLLISAAVIIAGIVAVLLRAPINEFFIGRKLFPFTGVEAIAVGTRAAKWVGTQLARPAQSYQPSRHLLPLLAVLGAYAIAVSVAPGLGGDALAPKISGIDRWEELIPLVVITIGVWATISAKNRIQAAVLLGVTGVGVTLQVLMLGAPDVALTQFMVEILTVVLMMLVLRFQPRAFHTTSRQRKLGAAVVAVAVGFATFASVWFLTGRRERPEVAWWYLDNTEKVTGETNIVNVILVEFRAFDTMGELSVLAMAGIAIAAVVASMPRFPHLLDHPGALPEPGVNAKLMATLVRYLAPVLFIISVWVLWRGGTAPGGGFNAALIGAATLMLYYLGRDHDGPIMGKNGPFYLSAGGIIVAISTGFLGYFEGSFLAPIYGEFAGQHLTSALLFDVGVYLAVLGIIAAALNYLGGPTRPGSEKSDEELGPDIAARTSLDVPPRIGVYASANEEGAATTATATTATATTATKKNRKGAEQ